ncbi:MAG: hypothetical protein HUK40_17295 [Desulfobacter sp.]|nr:hypothetical protein [Desulfobacter sp.]
MVKQIILILFALGCIFPVNTDARAFEKTEYLDQGWELYWGKLLDPSDFQDKPLPFDFKLAFPFFWNDLEIDSRKLPASGFLTLRKTIVLEKSLVGKRFGLRVPEMFSAYKLFVNGDPMAANGIVSDNPDRYQPHWQPRTISFTAHEQKIEFILQIANFSYAMGGGWRKIEFGPADKIFHKTQVAIFLDVFLFACVLTMGLYHAGLYVKRRRSKSSLFFALFCMVVALRTLVSGEILIYNFFHPSWEILLKLNFLTIAFIPPLFISFQDHLFDGYADKRIVKGTAILGTGFALFIILFPASIHSRFLHVFHFVGLAGCSYIFWFILKAVKENKDGALISLFAFLAPFLAGLNDILAVNNYINTEQVLPYGLIVYFIAQSILMAQRFSRALTREEVLSKELEELNAKLEDKVEERTQELKVAMSEIKQLSGMLPICSHCKKIRDDKGYWNHVEEYVSQHSEAVFSHGICPSCIQTLYPDSKLSKKLNKEK